MTIDKSVTEMTDEEFKEFCEKKKEEIVAIENTIIDLEHKISELKTEVLETLIGFRMAFCKKDK